MVLCACHPPTKEELFVQAYEQLMQEQEIQNGNLTNLATGMVSVADTGRAVDKDGEESLYNNRMEWRTGAAMTIQAENSGGVEDFFDQARLDQLGESYKQRYNTLDLSSNDFL